MGVGLKPVLFARNLTINSDVAPNYKYMFGPHRGFLLICETYIIKTTVMKHRKGLICDLKPEHKKTIYTGPR